MFIMLLAADSGGFGTLTMLLETERFSVFKEHDFVLRARIKNLRHRAWNLFEVVQLKDWKNYMV